MVGRLLDMDISDNQTNKTTSKNNTDQLDCSGEMSPNIELPSAQRTELNDEQSANFDGCAEKKPKGKEEQDLKGDKDKNLEGDEEKHPKDEEEKNVKDDEANFIQEAEASLLKTGLVETEEGDFGKTSTEVSKATVEQAMEILKKAENFQENGEYANAVSSCKSALHLLDFSQSHIDLRMKFCSNIMQLYYLMEEFGEVLVYYESCVDVLESVTDPKVIQTIMDIHALCMERLEE